MTEAINLAFCLFERDDNSPYAMALAATYSSIRQRTAAVLHLHVICDCLLYTSPSPRDATLSRMPSSA